MLVTVTGFGSVWRRRLGRHSNAVRPLAAGAYYNTTGVEVNGTIRTRPRIIGHARFNGAGGFDRNYPARMLDRVFECEDPTVWQGQNKILFKRLLRDAERPDRFLVVVHPPETGPIRVGAGWKSDDVFLVAFSEWRDRQELMLLMPAYGWLRSDVGTFFLEPSPRRPWTARLQIGVRQGG